jgi:hydroxylaminobenzene mutase
MGLSAHLEGLMNGTFLLALGAVWQDVRLSRRSATVAFASALYGAYANWVFTTAAAVAGTGAMTPLASAGRKAEPWLEAVVTAGFVSVGIAMLLAAGLLTWSFRRSAVVSPELPDYALKQSELEEHRVSR